MGGIFQWAGGPDRIKEGKEKAGREPAFALLLEPQGESKQPYASISMPPAS